MEFIHLKDMRAAGEEPVDVISGYQWKNNLGYYQVHKRCFHQFLYRIHAERKIRFNYDYICNVAGTFVTELQRCRTIMLHK